MGFFERPDPRLAQCADPTTAAAALAALRRHGVALLVAAAALCATYYLDVANGLHSSAQTQGTTGGLALRAPASVVRDARDVPHVRARNEHDLYFVQGFTEASDRLFQMDFTRRYAYGRLAEVLGVKALPIDRELRAVDISGIASRQWRSLGGRERGALEAYADGVNAAMYRQPLPVEFRLLLYKPSPWTPRDSLAIVVVASLELADSWHEVFARDAAWRRLGPRAFDEAYPLSDPRYDVGLDGTHATGVPDSAAIAVLPHRRIAGSNAWAAGSAHGVDGHALLANDPHLDLTIPGIWYAIDLEAPGTHVAGATIPGVPGVVLGHNERVAWAATNAQTATTSVYSMPRTAPRRWVRERFRVRFAPDVVAEYYRTATEFSVPVDGSREDTALVRWPVYSERRSALSTFLALDRATSARDALRILAGYRGSPQNFVVADASGAVAYHLAGAIPDDPAWGRYVHPATDLSRPMETVPFERLPASAPSARGIVVTANNKMYGAGYPLRLSPEFEPPYRAYRIAELLRARSRYDAAYFARMQMDTLSPIDLEIARAAVRAAQSDPELDEDSAELQTLRAWDGRFDPDSKAATFAYALRLALSGERTTLSSTLARLRGPAQADRAAIDGLRDAVAVANGKPQPWGEAAALPIEHPLAPLHYAFLNGAVLPGAGNEYTIHLQEPGFAQGFRAVWEPGAWDRGGIALPSGESGEPGSGHYTDLTTAWVAGRLDPLPFSRDAVDRSATVKLLLVP